MLRYLTAGESHGKALVAILEGCPANLPLSSKDLQLDLERRQQGYGRGPRMKGIETDQAEILSGVRNGKTIGSPISLMIPNKSTEFFEKVVTEPRPGHADLAGILKYNQKDVRNILERASARETAAKVALGAVAKKLLGQFKIYVKSRVVQISGSKSKSEWNKLIDRAKAQGETLGGVIEVVALGVPVGLGSYVESDRRLNGLLAQALMSIPAVKGVGIGLGYEVANLPGSKVQDEIFYSKDRGFFRRTNHAGGIEGGISNGEAIVLTAAVKPIATLKKPLKSVDIISKKPVLGLVERSDICAVEPAAIVGEAVVALVLANAFLEKFGCDSIEDISASYKAYLSRI
ncbi:MAG: chorismate synthase [Candidatus Margulisiibacteriota bacterium]